MEKKCFKKGCIKEVLYACKCSSPETLSCELHIVNHVNLSNSIHKLESIFMQPCEGTREAILEFLTKEKLKYNEMRIKIIDSFSRYLSSLEKELDFFTNRLDCCFGEINDLFSQVSQSKLLSNSEDPILGLLILHPEEAIKEIKLIPINGRDWDDSEIQFSILYEKLESLNRSFFTERCETYLEDRKMQNDPKNHNKNSKATSAEAAKVKESISLIINEKGFKNLKEPKEDKINFPNSQISTAANDINRKLEDIDTLRNKTAEILSRPNNPELELDFRATCSAYQNNSTLNNPPLLQAYKDYLNAYRQKTSLYNLRYDNGQTDLVIYNTETETEEVKIFETPQPLSWATCITQLPNGKLFCFGDWNLSGITVLIDVNSGVEVLPYGEKCYNSSCIYFSNSIYCFGGKGHSNFTLSTRFDLDQNRWIKLARMPQADWLCSSIIFNGNILISRWTYNNLLRYSIDRNSFSTIPYQFTEKRKKIMINADRLFLIECKKGSIYESEIGSDTNWRRIADSTINHDPNQVYCSYNKGYIYINAEGYFKFDLNKKEIEEIKIITNN